MPTVTFNKDVFEKLVGKKLPLNQLKDRISMLGTDLEGIEGNEITVEIFPDRPDMLSEQGFARAFSSFIGVNTGLAGFDVKKSGTHVKVEKTLKIWPHVVTAIVKGLKFDDEKVREMIQLQEKLGVTLCRDRKKGGIGIYPLDKVSPPVIFTTEKPEKIRFRPLEFPRELTGRQILSQHPTGRKYADIMADQDEFPIFVDSKGIIMSMPPIINSHDVGKITSDTRDVFIEATGPHLNTLLVALNIIVTSMADMGGKIFSLDIIRGKEKMTTPDLSPSTMKLSLEYANNRLGLELKQNEIKKLLEKMGYSYSKGEVLVPAYRADVIHPCDLVEDLAIAYGYENFKEEIPSVSTIGSEEPFTVFRRKVSGILVGLGLIELNTYHLTDRESQCSRMQADMDMVELSNALTAEYSSLRTWMIPSILKVMADNKHNEYPQKIFDIGTIFKKSIGTETGIEENERLAVGITSENADFTGIKQILDYLIRMLDLEYEIQPVEHPSFIPGRVGRVTVNKKKVAYIGEISPQVLSAWDLQMPVSCFELNLTDLFNAV
ncbi:phenylalanine--tRNA ligase subunit beta [Candidatus Woesearchaeota archaeon]|nr:phenylalanine--tRNA ligase subunit beta [Candidatus Woesearchaeota archaeon]